MVLLPVAQHVKALAHVLLATGAAAAALLAVTAAWAALTLAETLMVLKAALLVTVV